MIEFFGHPMDEFVEKGTGPPPTHLAFVRHLANQRT
jgi:hypothetical protein